MKQTLETVSHPATLSTLNTPQNRAFEWLVEEDPFISCPQDPKFIQRYILAAFYFSTGGGTWDECNAPGYFSDLDIANSNCNMSGSRQDFLNVPSFQGTDAWLSNTYECYWGGLACLNSTFCIDRIEIENNGLSGTIPEELKNLTTLRVLTVKNGTLEGTIPSEYGLFDTLRIFDVSFNQLTGPIPMEIYNNDLLLTLDVSNNYLTGSIAAEIMLPQSLQFVRMQANSLTGTIPEELGDLIVLTVFEAFRNKLHGSMPQSVCDNRDIYGGYISTLTVDCNDESAYFVNCSNSGDDACCTECPF